MATYVITGANRGIGLEFCQQLQQRGETVIGVCRSSTPELDALGVQVESGVDITDETSVRALGDRLSNTPIDCLINNAGAWSRVTLDDMDFDAIRSQFEVNAIGPLRVTHTLLPSLKDGGKIGIITSRMGSIDDNTSGGSYGYRMSKVALSMAGKSLSHDLKSRGIAVAILHPGLVQTRMTGFTPSGITTTESVNGLLARLDELTLDHSGSFWHSNGQVLPW